MLDSIQHDIDTSVTFPDFVIPFLKPWGIERVPGWRALPGVTIPKGWRPTPGEPGYEDPVWRDEHKAMSRELRDHVRPAIHALGNSDPEFAALERIRIARDPNYFGMVYGWIEDPQPLPDEEQDKPYAKFAYQCDNTKLMHDWIYQDRKIKKKIWRTKSRQLGISWDDEIFDTWFYLTQEGKVKLTSRSDRWVDNGLSTEAMLGKIKYNLKKIAEHSPYILPRDPFGNPYPILKLLSRPNYKHNNLINPETGTEILGEPTTTKVARGGTYTYGRVDEDAFIPNLNDLLTSMQGSCPRIFLASTEHFDEGFDHFEGWRAAKREDAATPDRDLPDTVREYNWHQNAYLDREWEQLLLASAVTEEQRQGNAREVFRDPFAGFGQWVYPEARNWREVSRPYRASDPLDITMDPAGTGDDFALLAAQATNDHGQAGMHVLWTYQKQLPNPLRIAHMATGIWPEPGDDCYPWRPDPKSEEAQIGALFYAAWLDGREVRWFSDPAGDQIHSRASFITMFQELTRDLRIREVARLEAIHAALVQDGKESKAPPSPGPITVRFKAIKAHRLFADREYALRALSNHITVQQGVPSAIWAKECAGKSSYNELTPAAVTDPKRKHDRFSHITSCLENYALYFRYRFVDPLDLKGQAKKAQDAALGRGLPATFGNRGLPGGFARRTPALPPGRGHANQAVRTGIPPSRISAPGD